ncbi:jg3329 [Pararge aegeria aegeria]|uniref:Jg3329 protein n=1 Tax=Pararge aegeria aegeria TaxID=348720 RepID=A0A8S4RUI5_9NEOP|nr:jg3329 [Pararge aegeria aegeria]
MRDAISMTELGLVFLLKKGYEGIPLDLQVAPKGLTAIFAALLAAQAALNAVISENPDADGRTSEMSQGNIEITVISSKESSKVNTPDGSTRKDWSEISSALKKGRRKPEDKSVCFVKPIILINDKLPEDLDLDQKWSHIAEAMSVNERLKVLQPRRKFKRKFFRSRRHAIFKRSYSIG